MTLVCDLSALFRVLRKRLTNTKGRMMMHRTEKIPWKSEGARHAQVDCHSPVPRVMPAAIKAPMLSELSAMHD